MLFDLCGMNFEAVRKRPRKPSYITHIYKKKLVGAKETENIYIISLSYRYDYVDKPTNWNPPKFSNSFYWSHIFLAIQVTLYIIYGNPESAPSSFKPRTYNQYGMNAHTVTSEIGVIDGHVPRKSTGHLICISNCMIRIIILINL